MGIKLDLLSHIDVLLNETVAKKTDEQTCTTMNGAKCLKSKIALLSIVALLLLAEGSWANYFNFCASAFSSVKGYFVGVLGASGWIYKVLKRIISQ